MTQTPELKRGIRLRDLTLFYVATTLSIRWTASAAAAGPGSLLIWIVALFCFFLPFAASVMELSSRHPQEGGLYIWTRQAFGDGFGFVAAWTYWMSNLPYFAGILYFGAASALFAFGPRAQALNASPLYFILFATGTLTLITVLNIRGINAGKWLNNITTLGGIVPLVVLIVLGAISWMRFGSATHFTPASFAIRWSLKDAMFWSSMFLAFAGIEAGSAMGDEIENPRRTIPLAILGAGVITALGYLAGTAALLIGLSSNAVSGPGGLIAGIESLCAHMGVPWLVPVSALLVSVSAVSGASAYLSSTSRLPFVAGIDHYLPPAFASIHPRFRTPWISIAVYGLAGILVALLSQAGTTVRGAYEVLVSMTVITTMLPFLFIFAAMIRLQREPAGPHVRRVPGGKPVAIALACVGLASTCFAILMSAVPSDGDPNKPLTILKIIGGTLLAVGAGFVTFLIGRYKGRKLLQASHSTAD